MRSLADAVAEAVAEPVLSVAAVHGGDTATAWRMDLASGRRVFAKTHPTPPPGFFTTEAAGLRWLAEPGTTAVADVVAVSDGDVDNPAHLVLEWIESGRPRRDTEAEFGRSLALLHRATPESFGRTDRRSTGSLELPNEPVDTWAEFYATQRMAPLARLARDRHALPDASIAALERLDADRLRVVGGPPEPPARLHGDLWAGNRIVDADGRSWLIDPAAHGGHREFDLAMMRLFGGFGSVCFAAYQEVAPLADGWRERTALHQVAPLVVHAIKFGGGYRASAAEAIATYA